MLHRSTLACLLVLLSCSRAAPPMNPAPVEHEPEPETPELVAEVPSASPRVLREVKLPEPAAQDAPVKSEPGSVKVGWPNIVYAQPRLDAPQLGMVAGGVRVAVVDRAAGKGCAHGWTAIAPKGWICAELEASTRPPTTDILPRVPRGARVPHVFGKVDVSNAQIYGSLQSAIFEVGGRVPEGSLTVRRLGTRSGGGRQFWKTRHGLIDAKHIRRYRGSRFSGADLVGEEAPKLPIAWTLRPADRQTSPLLAAPSPGAKVIGRIRVRTRVDVQAISPDGKFVRVGDRGWLPRRLVRIAKVTAPPTVVGPGERWLDIDLDEQVLVAYEGSVPMYATMISSGRPGHATPTGVFRINRKVAERTMNSMADSDEVYAVDKVPWTVYFAKGYALHAAYWHGTFGVRRSHGCVNLSPADARALYTFTAPTVAPGWSEIYGNEDQPGSVVRIRNRRHPEPELKGYAARYVQASTAS